MIYKYFWIYDCNPSDHDDNTNVESFEGLATQTEKRKNGKKVDIPRTPQT